MIAMIGQWALGLAAFLALVVAATAAMWLFFSEEGQAVIGFVAVLIGAIGFLICATYGLWSLGNWVTSLF